MVTLLEIPNFIYPIVFAGIAVLVIYSVQPPQVNYISAPISNFTNVYKSIPYTVEQPDKYAKTLYQYGLTNGSKHLGISKEEFVNHLQKSQSISLNCTLFKEPYFGAPYNKSLDCYISGEHYIIKQ